MKSFPIFAALILGFVLGWFTRGMRQSPKPQTQTRADTAEMARLYPATLALAASKDMRVLVLLSSNDVTMAKSLLLTDLKGHASSLSLLGSEYSLSDFDRKATK